MLKRYISLVTILALHITQVKSAVGIEKRIEVLKDELRAEISNDQVKHKPPRNHKHDYYDTMVTMKDDGLIKPIMQYQKKIHKKHKHHKKVVVKGANATIAIKPPTTPRRNTTPKRNSTPKKSIPHKIGNSTTMKNDNKVTPADVFYRRFVFDDEERNKPQKWTHCLDLITPHLEGYKETMMPKQVTSNDGVVRRLSHLLSLNTTDYSKEDIVSVLYQISNLRIRIFQWDYTAVTTILNIIIPGPDHSFRTLKHGIKAIFRKWHLDTTNMASFLEQTRIFRPPCIEVSEFGGSTKSSKAVRYTKPTPKNSDEDCED